MSEQEILNLLKNNEFKKAKELIESLLKTERENLTYIFYYGLILANNRRYKEAIPFFERVLLSDKNHYDSNFNMAGCYQGLLIFDKAILKTISDVRLLSDLLIFQKCFSTILIC